MTRKDIIKLATDEGLMYYMNRIAAEQSNMIHKTELEKKESLKNMDEWAKHIQEMIKILK
jgi:hypothetical protein